MIFTVRPAEYIYRIKNWKLMHVNRYKFWFYVTNRKFIPFSIKVKLPKPRSYFNPTLRSFSFFPTKFSHKPTRSKLNFKLLFTSARCYFSIRNSRGATWASTPKISISIGNTNQKLKSVRLSHCDKQKVQIFPAFKKTLKTAPINLFIRKTDTSPNTTQNKIRKFCATSYRLET